MSHRTKTKRKEAQTIDQVLQQLDEIVDTSIAQKDYLFLFTHVYRETTAEIKNAIQSQRFENPVRMEKMDVVFANLFINAYYDHQVSKSVASC
jgi:RNase H-fold protein (predicted Holliday junction resolvase)